MSILKIRIVVYYFFENNKQVCSEIIQQIEEIIEKLLSNLSISD